MRDTNAQVLYLSAARGVGSPQDADTPTIPQFLGVRHPAGRWKVLNPRLSACSASTSPASRKRPYVFPCVGLRSSEPGAFEAGRFPPGRLPQNCASLCGKAGCRQFVKQVTHLWKGNRYAMGQPKSRVKRGRPKAATLPMRVRLARRRKALRETHFKEALSLAKSDILPHVIGRREWRGMRDNAPEENGPVKIKRLLKDSGSGGTDA